MKRLYLTAVCLAVAVLLSGCPPQKQDICPGFQHCAVSSWQGSATQIYRGPDCGNLAFLAELPVGASTFTDTSVVAGQSYCYQVRNGDLPSNSFTVAIP